MKLLGNSFLIILLVALSLNSSAQSNSDPICAYMRDRGHARNFYFFNEQKVYLLIVNKPCLLTFCIESNYTISKDTIQTEKFGPFLIKRDKLYVDLNKINKGKGYVKLKRVDTETINCLKFYGIIIDSGRIIIPKYLL